MTAISRAFQALVGPPRKCLKCGRFIKTYKSDGSLFVHTASPGRRCWSWTTIHKLRSTPVHHVNVGPELERKIVL